jgi:DNA gyrase subunit A
MEQPVVMLALATNMSNSTEVIDGTLAYMDNNDIEIDELINYISTGFSNARYL